MKTKLLVLTLLLVVSPLFTFATATAADREEILYMTEYTAGGGVVESFPVIDMNGDLHTFLHIVTASDERLVHLYYVDGETTFDFWNNSSPVNYGQVERFMSTYTERHFLAYNRYSLYWSAWRLFGQPN